MNQKNDRNSQTEFKNDCVQKCANKNCDANVAPFHSSGKWNSFK